VIFFNHYEVLKAVLSVISTPDISQVNKELKLQDVSAEKQRSENKRKMEYEEC